MNRRNFIKSGTIWVPSVFGIFLPRLIRADNNTDIEEAIVTKLAVGGGGTPIAIDTSAKSAGTSSFLDSQTVAITVAGGHSNTVLIVGTAAGDVTIGNRTVDSVSSSINGAFTHVTSSDADNGNFLRTEFWRLINPTAGAHTITVTFAAGSTSIQAAVSFAISLYNVNQTTPVGTPATDNSTTAHTKSLAVTLGANDMAVGVISSEANATLTIDTGTERQKTVAYGSDVCMALATNTGTGSIAIAFTGSTPDEGYAFTVIPVAAA